METLEKIKEALKPLQQIDGVESCYLEEEEGSIVHVYTVTCAACDYDLDKRIFNEYAEIEKRFPNVSFEFRTTSLPPFPTSEVVF